MDELSHVRLFQKLITEGLQIFPHSKEQIYALFEANRTPDKQPWVLRDFCTHGERVIGERLVRSFNPLPEPPDYFKKPENMFYKRVLGNTL